MLEVNLKIKKLREDAILPTYGHLGDACFDLYAVEDTILYAFSACMVHTGLVVEIPVGWEMQVRPRSGLATAGVLIPNSPCTIDSGYRGEIMTPLLFIPDRQKVAPVAMFGAYTRITKGQRYAQATLKPIYVTNFVEVEELTDTERGDGGFGSTG